jgi:hypothetical protein
MRKWPIRQQLLVAYAVILMNFVGGLGLGFLVDQRLIFLSFVVIMAVAVYVTLLRCPRCKHFVFKHEISLGGFRWTYWGGNPFPRRCPVCACDWSTIDGSSPTAKAAHPTALSH